MRKRRAEQLRLYTLGRKSLWESFGIVIDHKYVLVTSVTLLQYTKRIHGYAQERGSNDG